MKAPGKLTLILMHDDGKAHRLRVGRKLFTVLVLLLVLLPSLGGLGIWVGVEAWQVWSTLEQERVRLQHGVSEWRLRAERLENVLRLAGIEHDVPGPLPAVTASRSAESAGEQAVQGEAPQTSGSPDVQGNGTIPVGTASVTASGAGGGNGTLPASRPATNATAVVSATAMATNGTAGASAARPAPPDKAAEAAPAEDAALDTGVVRLQNLTARVQDNRKLRIALDLYNARPNSGVISGHFIIRLIDPTGKPLPVQHDEGTFRITRFKKVIMQADLPAGVTEADNAALLVTVLVDEEPVLRNIFSVESR